MISFSDKIFKRFVSFKEKLKLLIPMGFQNESLFWQYLLIFVFSISRDFKQYFSNENNRVRTNLEPKFLFFCLFNF